MPLARSLAIATFALGIAPLSAAEGPVAPAPVSYYKDIRPIFQANCQGCHQPARDSGAYVMTSFDRLVKGGESEEAAIVPGKPDDSPLVKLITPHDGVAEMPKEKKPLADVEIELIRRWISEGASDDTPANARERYDVDHPPVYSQPPIVTSITYSPDGALLAVAGFHEVLLHKADGSGLVARLIGMSERIEAVAFSPDGKRLAVAGGNPCRVGELQVWDRPESDEASSSGETSTWKLSLSVPVTFDTIYGASWSPDGRLIAVGCGDTNVRAFDSTSGEQLFFNAAHDDWALDTVFSVDGSHLVSVGRDMATKLYEVKTQRFVDNVTSITPGALKGGISALDRHPTRDEVLVGGSDGTPRIYRMHRVTKRVIGDDANLIRRFPEMSGRIFSATYSPDGLRIACASALDGAGQVFTYLAELESEMPDEIKEIVQKTVSQQTDEEKQKLEAWVTSDVKLLTQTEIPGPAYTIDWSPDGESIAVAGSDGTIRFINPADGAITRELQPVEVSSRPQEAIAATSQGAIEIPEDADGVPAVEPVPKEGELAAIVMRPSRVELHGPGAYGQIDIVGLFSENGEMIDVTRLCALSIESGQEVASVNKTGRVIARGDGEAILKATMKDQTARIRVVVTGFGEQQPANFIKDVNPVLSRLGCNAGTCHGSKEGKNGFKLSLRGYDPIFDVRAFTDDLKSRRTNIASPDDSLMLLKATGAVPHTGGQLTKPGHPYYETIRRWIAEGAKLEEDVPRVAAIAVRPEKPICELIDGRQQFEVYARYTDGRIKDVTREAYIESGNTEVAVVNRAGIATAIRRGEAPIMARFEGQYAATTLTVMGDRTGFHDEWQEPESWGPIDQLAADKWKRMRIIPSELCGDEEFVRRVYLDLTGLPPSVEQLQSFLADRRPTREKRDALIDRLVGSDAYVDYWTNKWADLLQVNRKFLGPEGSMLFRGWIRDQVAHNTPYDKFSYEILTAAGSNKAHPAASYYKILREPTAMMENTTHLFLGVRFNCNKCHDHPFERWNQNQYYETAAFFAQVGLQRDPANKEGDIGGTAVEGAKPLWEVVMDKSDGEITHDRTGAITAPLVPYGRDIEIPHEISRREQLARWVTDPANDYFARSYVNRVWGYLMGVGLIEPLDDIRAGNPPSNAELLDWLTRDFLRSGFDVQHLMRTICKSRVYQLSLAANKWNEDDKSNYSHAFPKRLPAEVLYDSVYAVTGAKMQIPGVPEGTRAAALPDAGVELPDNFLANLGRPARESACECERSHDLQLGPVMALMNGPTVSEALSQPGNAIEALVKSEPDDRKLIEDLVLRVLNRPATPAEIDAALDSMGRLQSESQTITAERDAHRRKIAPVLAEREAKRLHEIELARKAHDKHAEEIRPREEKAEQERQEKIAAARQAVAEYEATLPSKLPAWELSVSSAATAWTPLTPAAMNASTGAKLEKLDDLSVYASGRNDKVGNYSVNMTTGLADITGFKLEVLTDPRLPGGGPGRAPNGNFVLTELSVSIVKRGEPAARQKLALRNAQADFSQEGYPVVNAIDGKVNEANNGWATHPKTGENRVATFELQEPLKLKPGTVLSFVLEQRYSGKDHQIGRFRISATAAQGPLTFGLPESLLAVIQLAPELRSARQDEELMTYFRQSDSELNKLQAAIVEAEKPRPEDPELIALRGKLEEAKLPAPSDPQLDRLERAAKLSEEQLHNARLTTAQDFTWALINSPAFLFNR